MMNKTIEESYISQLNYYDYNYQSISFDLFVDVGNSICITLINLRFIYVIRGSVGFKSGVRRNTLYLLLTI